MPEAVYSSGFVNRTTLSLLGVSEGSRGEKHENNRVYCSKQIYLLKMSNQRDPILC
jgi:hypothetical protein